MGQSGGQGNKLKEVIFLVWVKTSWIDPKAETQTLAVKFFEIFLYGVSV